MRTLLLLRHAKSSWGNPGLSDHERPLNRRGRGAAPQIGRWLPQVAPSPRLVLSSSAVRAKQTAAAVAEASGCSAPIQIEPRLYLASVGSLMQLIAEVPSSVDTLLVVAHNPGLEQLVALLAGHLEPFPTAALACFTFQTASWAECFAAGGRPSIEGIWRPRELEDG